MAVNREELIACLDDLIETCREGERGFRMAAEQMKEAGLKSYFERCSSQRAQFANELRAEVRQLGAEASQSGSVTGAFHRGWMNLESALTGGEVAIVSECEWGEDAALRNYERVLKQNLPPSVLPVVKYQYSQIKLNHSRIRDLEQRAA
jgi:uncharacterized protein (TIGR02284 family)